MTLLAQKMDHYFYKMEDLVVPHRAIRRDNSVFPGKSGYAFYHESVERRSGDEDRQILRGAAVFLAGAGILAGCGKPAPGEDGKIYVGVTYYNQTDTYLGELLNCLKKEWKERESEEVILPCDRRGRPDYSGPG